MLYKANLSKNESSSYSMIIPNDFEILIIYPALPKTLFSRLSFKNNSLLQSPSISYKENNKLLLYNKAYSNSNINKKKQKLDYLLKKVVIYIILY